jgi:integrase
MTSNLTSPDPAELYVARLSTPKSRETARCALRTLERAPGMDPIDWASLTYVDIARARAALTSYSPAWGSTCLSVLRSVLKEARRLGVLGADLVEDALTLPPIRGSGGRLGRDVTDAEMVALLGAIEEGTVLGRRDAAMVALLLAGLRCAETIAVEVDDVDLVAGRVTVRSGKGRRHRVVPLNALQMRLLGLWKADHPGDGVILRSVNKWGQISPNMSIRGVQAALAALCERAGIPRMSPHAIRAHQITAVIRQGDVFVANRFAGHVSLSTTMRYDTRDIHALEDVIASLPEHSDTRTSLRLVSSG